jgi:glucose-6-phosphate isomerase
MPSQPAFAAPLAVTSSRAAVAIAAPTYTPARRARCARTRRLPAMVMIPDVPSTAAATSDAPSSDAPPLASALPAWRLLREKKDALDSVHLRELLADDERTRALATEYDGVFLDYSRQRVDREAMELLVRLAEEAGLEGKIRAMVSGERINVTEDRAVLHTALRARKGEEVMLDGVNVVAQVHEVLDRIRDFSEGIRGGKLVGATGRRITKFIAVGIGGSYLGPEFVYEALKTSVGGGAGAGKEFELHFLANVDPVDVKRSIGQFDPETTMAIVISKTFTTRETLVNAKVMRDWLWAAMGKDSAVVAKHMVAVSTNVEAAGAFGIDSNNVFGFWDWVGGRYSVCSAVGALPLSLVFGFDVFERFLSGVRSMDKHLVNTPFIRNIPVLMGLVGVWNISFLGNKTRAMHPYTEALLKFPAHIQQVDMESNGKGVSLHGQKLDFDAGPIDFGQAGTNMQHSYMQLIHQSSTQIVPCDFIGFTESQYPLCEEGEPVSNHDELMSNYFAQADALAVGKTAEECRAEGIPEELVPHKTFPGNRPSLSLLLPVCNAYTTGQLLGMYEHRTAVEGFVWGINSFDQWGVELGKTLATKVRTTLNKVRYHGKEITGYNASTSRLIERYMNGSVGCAFDSLVEESAD